MAGDGVTGPDGDERTSGGGDRTEADGLSEDARDWVRRTVAELGPLTQDEREYLAWMFHRRV